MPPDFDPAVLVECDFSDDAAARHTLPWAFLQRWLALRDQVWILHPQSDNTDTLAAGLETAGIDTMAAALPPPLPLPQLLLRCCDMPPCCKFGAAGAGGGAAGVREGAAPAGRGQ